MHIPLVNAAQEIVDWTRTFPRLEKGRLRHADAERLLGPTILCMPAFLSHDEDMVRAGAPAGVLDGWWTLALCPRAALTVPRWGLSVRTRARLVGATNNYIGPQRPNLHARDCR
jgi:hypothetical protein